MADQSTLLSVEDISKSFGRARVLDRVSLSLQGGELRLLLGPNGAGKTTLARIMTSLVRPTAGRLVFRGLEVSAANRSSYRRAVGYISHQTFLYDHLTAEENLAFFGRLYGVPNLGSTIARLLETVGLEGVGDKRVGRFSRGMQQRLSLARVLMPDPSLLILDEPYTGLDPEGSRTLTRLLEEMKASSKAFMLVTHDLEDCLEAADTLTVLHRGRIAWEAQVGDMDLETLKGRYFSVTGAGGRP